MMQSESEAYQGYSTKTVLLSQKDLEQYFFFESEYAFRFHFDKNNYWGEKVVDFGGRFGEKTRKIRNVVVVEIDDDARKYMRINRIPCAASLEEFKDNSIDTIYCSHVLEHTENPIEYLNLFHKKLRGGGN